MLYAITLFSLENKVITDEVNSAKMYAAVRRSYVMKADFIRK